MLHMVASRIRVAKGANVEALSYREATPPPQDQLAQPWNDVFMHLLPTLASLWQTQ